MSPSTKVFYLLLFQVMVIHLCRAKPGHMDWGYPVMEIYSAGEYPSMAPTWVTLELDSRLLVGSDDLLVYNGYHWDKTGLSGMFWIRGLCRDPQNESVVWVGGQGGIGTLEHGVFTKRSPATKKAVDINGIYPLETSVIATSDEQIIRASFTENGESNLEIWEIPNDFYLRGMSDPLNQRVLIHESNNGIYEVTENSPPRLLCTDEPIRPSYAVGVLYEDGKTLLATSKSGLWELTEDGLKPHSSPLTGKLTSGVVTSVGQIGDSWYIGTFYNGLYLREGNKWKNLNKDNGAPSNSVIHLDCSNSSGVWIGFNNALALLDIDSRVRSLTSQNEFKDTILDTDIEGPNGAVLTFGGIYVWDENNELRKLPAELPPAYNVLFANKEELAVGAIFSVHCIDANSGDTIQVIPTPSDPFLIQRSSESGKLLLAGDEFLAELDTRDDEWELKILAQDFSGSIRSLVEYDNHIYAARPAEGILVVDRETSNYWELDLPRGIKDEPWIQIMRLGNKLLLKTKNSIWEWNKKDWKQLLHGDWDERAVTESPNGTILLVESEPRNIIFYDEGDMQAIRVTSIESVGQTNKVILKDDILWVCGNQGLMKVSKPLEESEETLRKPSINAIFTSASSGPISSDFLHLDNGESFRLELSGPLPEPFQEIYLQYHIPGLDDHWSRKTQDSTISISPLPHGEYTIEIRAIDGQGNTSPPVGFMVKVNPPWYLTSWALLFFALLIFLVAGIGYRIKLQVLKQRNVELQIRVDEKTEALRKAVRAKDEFMASVSHEIRNPLNGIVGLCEILQERLEGSENNRTLSSLKNCTSVLTNLVEDILEIGEIQTGKMRMRREPADIEALVHETMELYRKPAQDKGLTPEVRITKNFDKPCVVEIDPNRLRQILVNLVSNAIKYTQSGSVTLALQAEARNGEIDLEIDCIDSGPGITDSDKELIFELFGRREIHKETPGSGLGLALCRKIADNLDSQLFLKQSSTDESNHGSTFTFKGTFAKAVLKKEDKVQRPVAHLKILIVEDESYNREYLRLILEKTTSTITEAASTKEAIDLLSRQPFDVIFLDWHLKDGSGSDVIQHMDSLNREAIIIAATAYTSDEMKRQCLSEGCNFIIQKPYDEAEIFTIISSIPKRDTYSLDDIHDEEFLQLSLICRRNPERVHSLKREVIKSFDEALDQLIASQTKDKRTSEDAEAEAAHRLLNLASMTNHQDLRDLADYIEQRGATEQSVQQVKRLVEELKEKLRNWKPHWL